MSLQIRPAGPADIPELLRLVRALATYEKAPGEAKAFPEDYLRFGFGPKPYFEALLALWHGETAGFALYFFTFSTWTGKPSLFLEDLFVEPAHRRHGIGSALLAELARLAIARDCARFEWDVLDWNEPAIRFYESLGARARRDWVPFRLEGEALARLAARALPTPAQPAPR